MATPAAVPVAGALIVRVPAPTAVIVVPAGILGPVTAMPITQPAVEETAVSTLLRLVVVAVGERKPFAANVPVHCASTWLFGVTRIANAKAKFLNNCFMAILYYVLRHLLHEHLTGARVRTDRMMHEGSGLK